MKIPLRFQITEFDCGTVALQNAISYLFDRENVPAELIRAISIYTVNCYDEKGNICEGGTSRQTMNMMTKWIHEFANKYNFGINCTRLVDYKVSIREIRKCINLNGCVLLRTYQNGQEHFVVITDIDDDFVYMWDSYYLGETYYDREKRISIIFNKPFNYNRKVSMSRFLDEEEKDFALGPFEKRECLLFNKR
jgi:predicted double-glycine peptidase